MKRLLFLFLAIYVLPGKTQVIYPYRVCTSPAELREFSGLAKTGENRLAAINDGGNGAILYFMDTTGHLLHTRKFTNAGNVDWEEIFYGEGKLYIADVGDNLCKRKTMAIYHYDLEKDSIMTKTDFGFAEKNKIPLAGKDKHYDCEAGFFFKDKFYLFSKTHAEPYTGKSLQYVIEKSGENKTYTCVDSAFFGDKGFIYNSLTGAAISPGAQTVAFISCTRLWIRLYPAGQNFMNSGWLFEFMFDGLTQKEAITFLSDTKFLVADERTLNLLGGRMYFYDLQPYLDGGKYYIHPDVQQALLKKSIDNRFDFSFETLGSTTRIKVLLANEKGKIVQEEELILEDKKIKTVITSDSPDAVAFWVADGERILYTSKITGL